MGEKLKNFIKYAGVIMGSAMLLSACGYGSRDAAGVEPKNAETVDILETADTQADEDKKENVLSAREQYEKDGTLPSLSGVYQDRFRMGVAVNREDVQNPYKQALIASQFDSLTCENEMKADFVLDRAATLESGDEVTPKVNTWSADPILTFAQETGMQMRGHTLIWYSQTPRWLFTVGYDDAPDAPFVTREVMLQRMENYIKAVMEVYNTKYPGVIYAWDVVNEAVEPSEGHPKGLRTGSYWYQVIGEDYITYAFTFARKYAEPEQKLFYNDFNTYMREKLDAIVGIVEGLKEQELIDGVGMQSHIGMDFPSLGDYEYAVKKLGQLGLEVQVTELDVAARENSEAMQQKLAVRYRHMMMELEMLDQNGLADISCVTFWGLTDDRSWLNNDEGPCWPLLFDQDLKPKPAYFGVLQDASVSLFGDAGNSGNSPESSENAVGEQSRTAEAITAYKNFEDANPIMTQRFGADPWVLTDGDTVYIYMTADEPVKGTDGAVKVNDYANIQGLNVVSSKDLVNWTDCGTVYVAGIRGVSKWSHNSWAPAACAKEIDGKRKYFLYYADGGNGIGVLEGDSPLGPFKDPIGGPLISREVPGCEDVVWLFDPAVLVDDDGTGYLYFGGGVPEGQEERPGTGRVVKLGTDMVSLDGDVTPLDVPYLFEDSGINKIGDTYYYSYCSNWQVPEEAEAQYGFRSAQIVYMTGDSPMGPFRLQHAVLKNPGEYFGCYGNNHHCMFRFKDRWYIAYHTETLCQDMGLPTGYRCTYIDEVTVKPDGSIEMVNAAKRGVEQQGHVNPYEQVQAETAAVMTGVWTAETGEDYRMQGTGNRVVCDMQEGSWLAVKGVDFGEAGSDTFLAGIVPPKGESGGSASGGENADGEIEIRLDRQDGDCVGRVKTAAVSDASDRAVQEYRIKLDRKITNVHNLVFVFHGSGYTWDYWMFEQ